MGNGEKPIRHKVQIIEEEDNPNKKLLAHRASQANTTMYVSSSYLFPVLHSLLTSQETQLIVRGFKPLLDCR